MSEMEFSWNAGGQEPMDFSPIQPGKYPVCIIEVKPGTTKNGDNMVEAHCVIDADVPAKGRHIWNRVSFISQGKPGAGIAVHFLKTIQEPFEITKDFKVSPKSWIGKRFIATIINEKYINPSTMEERINNVIKGVEPVDPLEIMNSALAAKYKKTSDESVPF